MSDPIVLGAESVRAEIHEAPESHGLSEAQASLIAAFADDEIDQEIRAAADDRFWEAYDSVRRDAIARLAGDLLVNITHHADDDYERAVDATNEHGGSIEAVVAHLAQWDFGEETDGAAEQNGLARLSELTRLPHQLHEADHGGLHYWLLIDHGLRFYSLYRRPLGFTRAQVESDIDADDIRLLIDEAIANNRAQIAAALRDTDAVPGIRPFPRASVSALIDTYAEWDGEVDTFALAWENYTAGLDTPCPEHPAGIHSTYLVEDGSCEYCGEKNRG